MNLLLPANLAWLSVLLLILCLYLMKLRRRQVGVTAAFLWRRAAREARVDSLSYKLRVNLFLLLQLLAALAMVLALARPFLWRPGRLAHQVVILLDCSASMQARQSGTTRFELARQRARTLIGRARAGTELMVVAVGRSARVISPNSPEKEPTLAALAALQPEDVEGNLEAVRSLAASIILSRPDSEILLLGDRPPRAGLPPGVSFEQFGEPVSNVAVSLLQVQEERGRATAFVVLSSYSPQAESVTLELVLDGRLALRRKVQLAAGGRRSLQIPLPELPDNPDTVLEARLATEDGLEVDNHAWALARPGQSRRRLVFLGDINPFVERALLAQGQVQAVRRPQPGPPDADELLVWARAKDKLPPGRHLLLAPAPEWVSSQTGAPGVALVPEPAPLVEGLGLEYLTVTQPPPLKSLPYRLEVLARGGEGVALAHLSGDNVEAWLFNFPLERSDLPLSPALPMLCARILEAACPSGERSGAFTGQELSLPARAPVDVVTADGRRFTLTPHQQRVRFDDIERAGIYRWDGHPLPINFVSGRESDLRAEPEQTAPNPTPTPAEGQSYPLTEELWPQLVVLALLVLGLEWWLFWGGWSRLRRGRRVV